MNAAHQTPNRLSQESSPYLLQHAYNPVDWYPWGEEALQKAQAEDKPVLVSIGYASCHWCHVMEQQSFENEEVAAVMNKYFVCIKVDREERPDVDAIYMDALHAMGLQGGWPLNVFLTPDARPFYGGTYFPPQNWKQLLQSIADAWQKNRQELTHSAEQFREHLNTSELQKYGLSGSNANVTADGFSTIFRNFSKNFDPKRGGQAGAPKFPMPVNYRFLLRYYQHTKDPDALGHVILTLTEMAFGGIYDQIGGGFARYSVDENWLVPHFEKMLYDNGQLISLYSEAYQVTQQELFREVVYDTIAFVQRELTSPEGGFYSSLDADSEGEEGKFYFFSKEELQELLGDEEPLFSKYYHVTATGNWEHGQNILHRRISDEAFASANQLQPEVVQALVKGWKEKLLQAREKRSRPALDDKILTSWNALLLQGLTDAYKAFGEEKFLEMALRNARFLTENLKNGQNLFHNYKNGKATVNGFLEDYALLSSALTSLYEVTFDEQWLRQAKELTQYTLKHFYDEQEQLFFFTGTEGEQLIARKKELLDNVMPASNSVMALNLLRLGIILDKEPWQALAAQMLANVTDLLLQQPSHLANWGILYHQLLAQTAEIAIVGPEAEAIRKDLAKQFLPAAVLMGTTTESTLPLLEDRTAIDGKTTVYVCYNKTCQLPVHSADDALEQLT